MQVASRCTVIAVLIVGRTQITAQEDAQLQVDCRTTEKMRSRLHDAMIVDFVFFILNLEEAGHADTEALNGRGQLATVEGADVNDGDGIEGEVDGDGIQEEVGQDVQQSDLANPESQEPAPRPNVIQDRVTAIKATPRLTAVTYVKLLKAMVRELCSEDPDVCPATWHTRVKEFINASDICADVSGYVSMLLCITY